MNGILNFGVKMLSVLVVLLIPFVGASHALEISLEPAHVQREVGGKVRVHIYATGASELISMGVKVSFDPTVLQVSESETNKNTDFATGFVMDADGVEGTSGDTYTTPPVDIDNAAGTVVMIGGRLMGDDDPSGDSDSLSGKVLLGWIVFEAQVNGNSLLTVDLGKYHPNHSTDTFDNFVQLDGTVVEPTNIPSNPPGGGIDLGSVCVKADACEGDIDNDGLVWYSDFSILSTAWNTSCGDANYNPAADLDGDCTVYYSDFSELSSDWDATCSPCP